MEETIRLLLLPHDAAEPATCLQLDARGRVLARLVPTSATPLPAPSTPVHTVLAVPGAGVRATWLALEAHSEAQARAAARAQVADDVASAGAGLHVALGTAPAAGGERLVLVADAACMRGWLARASALGASVDALVPDYLLLSPPADGVQVAERDGQWLVRGERVAFSAEPALAAHVVAGRPQRHAETTEALLAAGTLALPVDLLQGEFARHDGVRPARTSWRRVAVLAALLAASPLLLAAVDAARNEWSARQLRAQAGHIAARVVPGAPVDDASSTMAHALASLAAGDQAARLLHAVFSAVSAQPGAELERLDYANGRLEAGVRHRDDAALAAMVAALATAGFEAEAAETQPAGDARTSKLRVGGGP